MPRGKRTKKVTKKVVEEKPVEKVEEVPTKVEEKPVEKVEENPKEVAKEVVEEEKKEEVETPKEEKKTKSAEMVDTVNDLFDKVLDDQKTSVKLFRAQIQDIRGLKHKVGRMVRLLRKEKRNRRDQKSKPSGFNKPIQVSKELCDFLAIDKDVLIARTTVTKKIHEYIKEHELKDTTDGRKIIPDAKLTELLKLKKDDELTFFNLQKYLNKHFTKKT